MTAYFLIQGVNQNGKVFRPSDWAERLAGVMNNLVFDGSPSSVRPRQGMGYSKWCIPMTTGSNLGNALRCLAVHPDLKKECPMAFEFVMGFAKDNQLQISQVCVLPEHDAQ
jgi:hypothetical protein